MNQIEIHPSILSADFSELGNEIRIVESAGVEGIHFDVMDGHFVPNISFGAPVLTSIRKTTKLPFYVHLMITDPVKYTPDFIKAGADCIFVHPETGQDIVALAGFMEKQGVRPGIAINPETSVDEIKYLLPSFKDFLVMTVHPGFGGQTMIVEALEKVTQINKMSVHWPNPAVVHVDGGVNAKTAGKVAEAGTTVLVAGSSVYNQSDKAKAIQQIRKAAMENIVNL